MSIDKTFTDFEKPSKIFKYGTAGFRDAASVLTPVFKRVGLVACLKSMCSGGKSVGVVVTASHNAECDNGAKIVDVDGGMLHEKWEPLAEEIVNAPTHDLSCIIRRILNDNEHVKNGTVILGRDTRPHSKSFANCVERGVEAVGGAILDLQEVTTPQLHFTVRRRNCIADARVIEPFNAELELGIYFSTVCGGFDTLMGSGVDRPSAFIAVDCACGIGALGIVQFNKWFYSNLSAEAKPLLKCHIVNDIGSGSVNSDCGAEHVQKKQIAPKGFTPTDISELVAAAPASISGGTVPLCCSLDGDADRIVFHTYLSTQEGQPLNWVMLDGDKIAILFALYIMDELKEANIIPSVSSGEQKDPFRFGVVQTAYANGSSTAFLRAKGIPVLMAKTGVKYLHHVACKHLDCGIYFEANGHGTVFFSDRLMAVLQSRLSTTDAGTEEGQALARVVACTKIINPSIGDALSDLLFVVAILHRLNLSVRDWHLLYSDLPSRQLKVPVLQKHLIECSEDETYVVSPSALQQQLNILVAGDTSAMDSSRRAFIRPSGTEDVVRIYAEASSQECADTLAHQAVDMIKQGGF